MELRPYQHSAVEAVYRHLREHDGNPVVVIPTGGGKTPVMATICRDAVRHWNGRVLILAHVKELLQQSVDKLKLVCPELPVGVFSAGLNRRDTQQSVIVAGIQSVYQRAADLGAFDLVLIDECHLLPADGEGMYRQFLADATALNPALRVVGFTATPFRLDAGPNCRDDHFLNTICYDVGIREL
ncbi:MAG: DEAD/DEAH box helicase, partial [Planctomycetaceae bacterium]